MIKGDGSPNRRKKAGKLAPALDICRLLLCKIKQAAPVPRGPDAGSMKRERERERESPMRPYAGSALRQITIYLECVRLAGAASGTRTRNPLEGFQASPSRWTSRQRFETRRFAAR